MNELDFSKLLENNGRVAVYFADHSEATEFLEAIEPLGKSFRFGDHWGIYGDQTAYAPYLGRTENMTFESISHFRNKGFKIIPYSDLVDSSDLVESDREIEWLFT